MSMLWRQEEFLRICSKEDLAVNAQDKEVIIPIKKKSGDTVQPRSSVFLRKSFLGQANEWGRNRKGSADRIYWQRTWPETGRGAVPRESVQTVSGLGWDSVYEADVCSKFSRASHEDRQWVGRPSTLTHCRNMSSETDTAYTHSKMCIVAYFNDAHRHRLGVDIISVQLRKDWYWQETIL